jgi:hypothetical protein
MKKSIFLAGLFIALGIASCDKNSLDKNFSNETIATTTTTEVETTVCETAFAYKNIPKYVFCFLDLGFNRWGWTNGPVDINGRQAYYSIYAGAGQCDVSKGTYVGQLVITNNFDGTLTAFVDLFPGYGLSETHLYIGTAPLPLGNNGNPTVAPGQYPYKHENLNGVQKDTFTITGISSNYYVIFHAVVCGL